MSDICPTISDILKLDHDDLVFLQKQQNVPLNRSIGISLECSTTFDSKTSRTGRLKVLNWNLGTTELCGSCSFCNLLLHGVQSTLDSKFWIWKTDGSVDGVGAVPKLLYITLDRLFYKKDSSPWAVENQRLSTWNVSSVSLMGHTYLASSLHPRVNADLMPSKDEIVDIEVSFQLFAEPDDPAARFLSIHRRPLEASPVSEENLAKMKKWIKICDESHERCWGDAAYRSKTHDIDRSEARFLPTRLLEVGDESPGRTPRLVIAKDIWDPSHQPAKDFNYIALSYCWGFKNDSRPLLKTTHSNIRERLESIPIDIMPQAFKDAITLARLLEIRYVWIDSLCIIQDDSQDWQIESSTMAEIFSHAYLTVIATRGESCHDSFLKRNVDFTHCNVSAGSTKLGILEGQCGLRYHRSWGSDKMVEIDDGRWVSRGWTFQEERLARRALLFGKNKFFLDCRTVERAEDTEKYRLRPDWVDSVSELPGEEKGGDDQGRTVSDHWQTLCSHYSYRELTFPQDKLPAISGIASKFSKKVQSEYLAGLWQSYLLHDLFWFVTASATRPVEYRAPSWSWASVDGHIMWPRLRACKEISCEPYCTILEAKTTALGLDPFGAVGNGFLKISGTIIELSATVSKKTQNSFQQWDLSHLGHSETRIAMGSLDIGNFNASETSNYWALLIAKCKKGKKKSLRPRGLLLLKNGLRRDGLDEFQRVGTFSLATRLPYIGTNGESADLWTSSETTTLFIV